MKHLFFFIPTALGICAAADTVPQLHVRSVDFYPPSPKENEPCLVLKLAALTDKTLHERCLKDIECPPENFEEDPNRYEEEKIWAEEYGGYVLVGRSCITAVKADLKLTDATGTVLPPTHTEVQEENGVLLITLEFDSDDTSVLPKLDTWTISGSLQYKAHYNHDSELTPPVDYTIPGKLTIGEFELTLSEEEIKQSDEEAEEDTVDVDEEQAEEEEGYDSSFYAEEKEDAKKIKQSCITITPRHGDNELYHLITNILIYEDMDGEIEQWGTFGNGDITFFSYTYHAQEPPLPRQGKISLRLRRKAWARSYQFNQKIQILNSK